MLIEPILSNQPAITDLSEHQLLWSDRLQDWLDGDTSGPDAAGTQAHLAGCDICQAQLAQFQQLDAELQLAAPPMTLDASFDARLFSQIDALNDASRTAARRRLDQEMRDNVQALSRGWRQSVALVVPGVVAGIALAVALVTWFSSSGLTQHLASEGAQEFGQLTGAYVQLLLTAFIGAGVGAGVAGWLALAAD